MSSAISASDRQRRLWSDNEGSALLEFSVFAMFFFTLLFGIVEFTFAYFQWNAATKAVQFGARLAAVSDPVASNLTMETWIVAGIDNGDPVPLANGFTHVCTATGPTTGTCTNSGTYSADAMNTLVYGRGNGSTCSGTPPNIGMCNFFYWTLPSDPTWRFSPENVRITYSYTGLGFAGRPGGPVPTIKVELINIPFEFLFLAGLMGFDEITIPGLASTVTGEDLSTPAPGI